MRTTVFLSFRLLVFCVFVQWLAARQPNVVVILTDDQGWGDLSFHGNGNLATPNIDSLARQGATLQYFYVSQVCAPTRAEFLTDRYYPRTGVSGVSTGQERLNYDETTIADLFQANGYATGAFGKWHNGTQPPYHPNNRGFDEYYGFTSGHWGHYFSPPLDHNGRKVRGNGYVVDDFTERAMAFIEEKKDTPFFCYLATFSPHTPLAAPEQFIAPYRGTVSEDAAKYLGMVANIDYNVGRILGRLEHLGIADKTIVVFMNDNGATMGLDVFHRSRIAVEFFIKI